MRWLAALLLLLTACCQQARPAPQSPSEAAVLASMRAKTVQIQVSCMGVPFATGSAVLVGGRYLATANHVAVYGCTLEALGGVLEVVYRDPAHDLAILRHPTTTTRPLRLNTKPYLGQRVICIGFSAQYQLGGETKLQVSRGEVIIDYDTTMRVGCSYESGSSGGPVFDESGMLVGLSSGARRELNDEYIVVPSRWIEAGFASVLK